MKYVVLLALSCTIMLLVMAQSPIIGNKISINHYKNEFNDGFMSKTNSPQFDFKTKHKANLRSISSTTHKLDSMVHTAWNSTTSQWENSDTVELLHNQV